MGSAFEQLEDNHASNLDGANPELSDSFKFAEVSFTEQDGLYVRRSLKARNIVEWCKARGSEPCFGLVLMTRRSSVARALNV